ncbi:MAG: hypothetical protein IKI49_01100 [Oscillospiraceae bacterium]|nr:hypothetical protein [Oscillospiraceae bacterium]
MDTNNGSFKADKLELELSRSKCFYDEMSMRYTFPCLEFGKDLKTTEESLGFQKWYNEERLRKSISELEQARARGARIIGIGDYINVNAFDAIYAVTYEFSQNLECFAIKMGADIFITDYDPVGIYTVTNKMSYNEACEYYYNLYDQFVQEYGEPDRQNSDVDLAELTLANIDDKSFNEVYALWISGQDGSRGALQLSAKVYKLHDLNNEPFLAMGVRIIVEQEIRDVSFDDADFLHPVNLQ